jgi:hypothetical protein
MTRRVLELPWQVWLLALAAIGLDSTPAAIVAAAMFWFDNK